MFKRVLSACIVMGSLCCLMAQAQTLPPVEAFGRLPFMSEPRLSPDAQHFAVIQSVNGRPAAVVYSIAGGAPAVVTSEEGVVDRLIWAKNDRLIAVLKQGFTKPMDRLRTWRQAIAFDVTGKNMVKLLRNMPALGNNLDAANVIDVNLDDPDHIDMLLFSTKTYLPGETFSRLAPKKDDGFKLDVVKVDVRSGKGVIEKSGDYRTSDWVSDGHGNPVVQIYQTHNPLQDHVQVLRNGVWTEIGAFDATEDRGAGIEGLSEDGKSLIQDVWNEQSFFGMNSIDIVTGAAKPLLFEPRIDLASAIKDEWTGRVIGAAYIAEKPEVHYFDPQRQALQNGVADAFPGLNVRIVSWDAGKTNVILAVEGPRQPEQYYLLNRTTHQTQLISGTYPALKDSDLGEMKPYTFKVRDGLTIPGYLTLPPGKQAKNLPLVVMPHGGPDLRDYVHFDWMAQFLANRGYAVFQPNFRGSSGYGHKFTEAGLQQWGLKMQDDVTDGVRKLVIDGIANPKRICIVGASYGGYAALAGATFTPDLYACAISLAGVSDLPAQLGKAVYESGGLDTQTSSFWKSRMGENMSQLAATSPARNADKVKIPILLLHGKNDTTVRVNQSELMADALKQAGKPVEFVTFEGEDHYLELADTRIRVLTEMERFLKKHIGN